MVNLKNYQKLAWQALIRLCTLSVIRLVKPVPFGLQRTNGHPEHFNALSNFTHSIKCSFEFESDAKD